jgi:hypothetical protein
MNPTTMHQLTNIRQADYRREAAEHRLAMLATRGSHDRNDAITSLRRTIDLLFHPLRTTGSSPA